MSSPETTRKAEYEAVAAAIRGHDRFLVTSHENPDGDALGSLLAMHLALRQLGKDSLRYLGGPAPLPAEYCSPARTGPAAGFPADHGDRVLVAVDCANEDRIGSDPAVLKRSPL